MSSCWSYTGALKARDKERRGALLASSWRADCCCWRRARAQVQGWLWRDYSSCSRSKKVQELWLEKRRHAASTTTT